MSESLTNKRKDDNRRTPKPGIAGSSPATPAGRIAGEALDINRNYADGSAGALAERLDVCQAPQYIPPNPQPARYARISGAAVIPEQSSPLAGSSFETRVGQRKAVVSTTLKYVWRRTRIVPTMAFSPFKFLQEVRSETAKVTWPTRRETTITTIMVFVMVAATSIFFFAADQIIRVLVTFVLGIH